MNKRRVLILLSLMSAIGAAHAGSDREAWLKNPVESIPDSVTDADIEKVSLDSTNAIFNVLKSNALSKSYMTCQSKSEGYYGKLADDVRAKGNASLKSAEQKSLFDTANAIEKSKAALGQSHCFLKTFRRTALTINLEQASIGQPKHGMPIPADEQFRVEQVSRVAKALASGELTKKFYDDLGKELEADPKVWWEEYVKSQELAKADLIKSQLRRVKDRGQVQEGAEYYLARKQKSYGDIVNTVSGWINGGAVNP